MDEQLVARREQFLHKLEGYRTSYFAQSQGAGAKATITALAAYLGCNRGTLYRWLRGDNAMPRNALDRLCKRMDLSDEQRNELLWLGGYIDEPVSSQPAEPADLPRPDDASASTVQISPESSPPGLSCSKPGEASSVQISPESSPPGLSCSKPGEASSLSTQLLEDRYIDALRHQYGYVMLSGMAMPVYHQMLRIPLDDLFIEPSAEYGVDTTLHTQFVMRVTQGYQAVRTNQVGLVGFGEIKSSSRSVILGMPGAGKSTLLYWMILEACRIRDSGEYDPLRQPIPVFIRLTHIAQMLQHHSNLTLEQYLQQWCHADYQSLIQSSLKQGRIWLLLDGVDEIVDIHDRLRIIRAIEVFAVQFPYIERIMITSRVVGYRRVQLSDTFRHFSLRPFGLPEIARFVHQWFQTGYRLTQASPDYAEAERRAKRLLEGLTDKPRVLQLAGTPLFLMLIVLMDWKGKEIPKRRVELYEAATKTLLEDWPVFHGRPIQDEISMDEMLRILAQLALEIFKTSQEAAIRQDVLEVRISEIIRDVCHFSLSDATRLARRWIPLLSEHSGLLMDAGTDMFNRRVYTFLHLSFVEYLCGRALAALWRDGSLDLAIYADDPRWREVILLIAGYIGMDYSIDESTRLAQSILTLKFPYQDILHQPLILVAICLADDVRVSKEFQSRIVHDVVVLWYRSPNSRLKSKLFRLISAMRGTESAPEVIKQIIHLLDSTQEDMRSGIIELIGNIGCGYEDLIKPILLKMLNNPIIEIKRSAIRAVDILGIASDRDVRALLIEALEHANAGIRTRSVLALGPFANDDPSIAQLLLCVLNQDRHEEPQRAAARMLSSIRNPNKDILEALWISILNSSGAVRKESIAGYVLWDTRSREWIILRLRELLSFKEYDIRRKSAEIVADIALVLRSDAHTLLIEAIQDELNHDIPLFVPLIRALGNVPSPKEQTLLLLGSLLQHTHPKVRLVAATALGRLAVRNQYLTSELVKVLNEPNTALRRIAASALGVCGIPGQVVGSALKRALDDSDEIVSVNAAKSLICLNAHKGDVISKILTLMQSNNADIRLSAVMAVQGVVHTLPHSIITILIHLVGDSYRNVSEQALRALAELGQKAHKDVVAACIFGLRHMYHGVRVAAVEALGRIKLADETVIAALLAALADPVDHVRIAASSSLVAISQDFGRKEIADRVRLLLDQHPNSEGVLNALWELVVAE